MVLEVQGLVETRHGGGSYLRVDGLNVESIDTLISRRQRLPDIIDAREAIEVKLASLAADRRTTSDLAALGAAIEKMRQAVADGEQPDEGDREFHLAMAVSGHSPLLLELYKQLAPHIVEVRRESLRQPGRPTKSLMDHERILEAIKEGSPSRAATAVRKHVRTVRDVRLLMWDPDTPSVDVPSSSKHSPAPRQVKKRSISSSEEVGKAKAKPEHVV